MEGKLSSTILSVAILNGVNPEGEGTLERSGDGLDFLAQGFHLFGANNSIGGFYYRGNTKFNAEDSDTAFKDTIDRYGVVGNYFFADRYGAIGGLIAGKDKSTELSQTITNRGWFLEADISASPKWSFSYRHDEFDPDTDLSGDRIKADTISTRFHPVDNVLLTLEYNTVKAAGEERDYSIFGQVKLAY